MLYFIMLTVLYGIFMYYFVGGIFIVPHLRLLLNIVRIDKMLLD